MPPRLMTDRRWLRRHDVFDHSLAAKYPESFDPAVRPTVYARLILAYKTHATLHSIRE